MVPKKYQPSAKSLQNAPMNTLPQRVIYFVTDQMIKTMRRPSRIVLIPYNYIGHCNYIGHFLQSNLRRYRSFVLRGILRLIHVGFQIGMWCTRRSYIPVRWLPKQFATGEAIYQFNLGQKLLGENKPDESWLAFQKCLKCSDEYVHFTMAAVCLYAGMGRMGEAISLFKKSNEMRLRHIGPAASRQLDRYCVLDGFWPAHIGHAAQIDFVIKLLALQGRDPNDTILYVPPDGKIANRFLIEQWKSHLRLISDPLELPFPKDYVKYLSLDYYVPHVPGIGKYYFWELAAQTYQRWAAEGRQPLLKLSVETQERGRNALMEMGLPKDTWFVGLHVREPEYQRHHRGLHNVLNAKIEDYLPAIEEITHRGGWVIRMGDPLMTQLPPLPNVLDYCHSAIRSDWMDVYLAATSRFFIGTSSGVCYVAQDYGVPCVLTNWWPPAQRPWQSGDIFIPKLLRRVKSDRILSLAESLNEPFGYCNSVSYLREKHGVAVQDNDPGDIRGAVIEMLERIDGKVSYDQSDLDMRAHAEGIYASEAMHLYDSTGAFGAGSLARDFLKRYPRFVDN
jgi:putative glycosyltransferase (TIGR04372 family)